MGWDHRTPPVPEADQADDIEALRRMIADDGFCATFQTIGQYRTALLKFIKEIQER